MTPIPVSHPVSTSSAVLIAAPKYRTPLTHRPDVGHRQRLCTTHLSHPSAAQRATTGMHRQGNVAPLHIPRLPALPQLPGPCGELAYTGHRSCHSRVLGQGEFSWTCEDTGDRGIAHTIILRSDGDSTRSCDVLLSNATVLRAPS